MQGLTQWQFITIGIYFGLATCLTYLAMSTPPETLEQRGWATVPAPPACAAASLLGVALSLALLTTTVTSFVLIPWAAKKGNGSMFFSTAALLMHNANSLLLVLDLLAGKLHVDVRDIACCSIACCSTACGYL